MEQLVTLSIGIGLVISLAFSELFGLAAGGMVVPGYVALYLDRPIVIVLTLLISYLTYFIVHSLSAVMIIYGRRRTVLMILVGFAMGALIRSFGVLDLPLASIDLTVIGYIIPGLIAIWIDRQGLIESFAALIISSVLVRLLLIIITGVEFKL
jgi:poly-gamma-glutamate biosynthesis protein PgsC/CapC